MVLVRAHLPRLLALFAGLALYGVALAFMVQAAVGLGPWDVLSQGLSRRTGLPFGVLTIIIGALVLLLWIPLRQRVGFGTLANVVVVGAVAQAALAVTPSPDDPLLGSLLFATGLILLAIATGMYVGAGYGPGPRDGLMTGMVRRLGWPIWAARGSVELTVLGLGWLLGGDVGLGTVAFAFLVGPLCALTVPFFERPRRERGPSFHRASPREAPAR